jgi:hypothetical protein
VIRRFSMARAAAFLAVAFLSLLAVPASAAVQITFYSKELSDSFPHAFVIIEGTPDRGGERIKEDYGFSAKTLSPAILWGKVKGVVLNDHSDSYVRASDPHFTLNLSDAEYDRVLAVVEQWRTAKQPSYDLDKANCVHFVGALAATIGMEVDTSRFMKKPRSFLAGLTERNQAWLKARNAVFHRAAAPAKAPLVVGTKPAQPRRKR